MIWKPGCHGLKIVRIVWSEDCMVWGLHGLRTVWSADCMVCGLYVLRTVWSSNCLVCGRYGLGIVWSADCMVWQTVSIYHFPWYESMAGMVWKLSLSADCIVCGLFGEDCMVFGPDGLCTLWSADWMDILLKSPKHKITYLRQLSPKVKANSFTILTS